MNILEQNDSLEKGTFLHRLYYKNEFDQPLFIDLINELVKLFFILDFSHNSDFVSRVFNIYGYTNYHIISVLNKTNPNFELDENYLNNYNMTLCLERFRDVIKFFIENNKEALLSYEDDIGKLDLFDTNDV